MDRASVGRIVHYVAYGTPGGEFPVGACRAAIVTEVSTGGVAGVVEAIGVCVLNPTGLYFQQDLPHDEETKRPGSWHWPERTNP